MLIILKNKIGWLKFLSLFIYETTTLNNFLYFNLDNTLPKLKLNHLSKIKIPNHKTCNWLALHFTRNINYILQLRSKNIYLHIWKRGKFKNVQKKINTVQLIHTKKQKFQQHSRLLWWWIKNITHLAYYIIISNWLLLY